jgi:hypothetical protein
MGGTNSKTVGVDVLNKITHDIITKTTSECFSNLSVDQTMTVTCQPPRYYSPNIKQLDNGDTVVTEQWFEDNSACKSCLERSTTQLQRELNIQYLKAKANDNLQTPHVRSFFAEPNHIISKSTENEPSASSTATLSTVLNWKLTNPTDLNDMKMDWKINAYPIAPIPPCKYIDETKKQFAWPCLTTTEESTLIVQYKGFPYSITSLSGSIIVTVPESTIFKLTGTYSGINKDGVTINDVTKATTVVNVDDGINKQLLVSSLLTRYDVTPQPFTPDNVFSELDYKRKSAESLMGCVELCKACVFSNNSQTFKGSIVLSCFTSSTTVNTIQNEVKTSILQKVKTDKDALAAAAEIMKRASGGNTNLNVQTFVKNEVENRITTEFMTKLAGSIQSSQTMEFKKGADVVNSGNQQSSVSTAIYSLLVDNQVYNDLFAKSDTDVTQDVSDVNNTLLDIERTIGKGILTGLQLLADFATGTVFITFIIIIVIVFVVVILLMIFKKNLDNFWCMTLGWLFPALCPIPTGVPINVPSGTPVLKGAPPIPPRTLNNPLRSAPP